ncbi:MAG: aldo/keto reductase, partial [Actinomycetota bacterium]
PYEFGWGPVDDRESIAAIRYALERGVTWVDTAAVYGRGHSEEIVGRALQPLKVGEEVLVFTKCGRNFYGTSISSDLRPQTIRGECEESLRRLGVDQIDLYQFHWPDPDTGTPVEESWATMDELVREGKVRWAGVSNFTLDLLERCEAIRHVDSLQPRLNLIDRAARRDLLPWCRNHGTGVIVYSPMASGLLTGTFTRERMDRLAPDDWRRNAPHFAEPALSRNLHLADRLRPLAESQGTTVGALAVAWTLAVPGVTGAIVGARSRRQVEGWIEARDLNLSPEDIADIGRIVDEVGAGEA